MTADLWPAPTASSPVDATVTVPGSKSVTNRALVLGALASEPGWIRRPLRSRDTLLMAAGLRAMGKHVSTVGDRRWIVRPRPSVGAPAERRRRGEPAATCPRSERTDPLHDVVGLPGQRPLRA